MVVVMLCERMHTGAITPVAVAAVVSLMDCQLDNLV